MSKSTTIALAVGAGYVLGRKHKLRMAALLAGAAATGSAGGLAGRALRSGGKLLASPQMLDKLPPEAAKLAGLVRSDLAQAGKAAAQAAVSNRIEGLTSSLYERADAVRGGGTADEPADDEMAEDETDAGEPDDEEPAPPRASTRRRPAQDRERPRRRPDEGPERRRRPAPDKRAERDERDDDSGGRDRRPRTRTGSAPVRKTGR